MNDKEIYNDHQDWETLYVNCKTTTKGNKKVPESKKKYIPNPEKKLDKQIENGKLKHNVVDSDFSKKVQQKRLSMGLTQKQLATKLNIPVQTISEIENGKAKHNQQIVNKIKRIIKI